MSARRLGLWARARALDVAADPGLSPRARRLAQRVGAPLSAEAVLAAPDWLTWGEAPRERLALLAGATAVAPAWRRSVAGPVLRQAAAAIGETALDALLSGPDGDPEIDDPAARSADPDALARLGRAALVAESAEHPALARRIGEVLAAQPWPAAAFAANRARALMAQLGETP